MNLACGMNLPLRVCLVILLCLGSGAYYYVQSTADNVHRMYREATEEPLVDFAHLLALQVPPTTIIVPETFQSLREAFRRVRDAEVSAQIYDVQKSSVDLRVYATDAQGRVLFDSDGGRHEGQDYSQWLDVYRTLRGEYGARTSRDDPTYPGSVLYVAAPIKSGNEIVGSLTVAKPNRHADARIAYARSEYRALGLISFGLAAFFGILLAWWVSRPLDRLTAYARAIAAGQRPEAPMLGAPELRSLATAINEMHEALEDRKYVERYVETLTHEVKSPLTAIRGATEILREDLEPETRQQFLGTIEREAKRIQTLVEKLLSLSHLQASNRSPAFHETLVSEIFEQATESFTPAALQRNLTLSIQVSPSDVAQVEPFWMIEAIRNLVGNAIEFSPPGSTVTLRHAREGDHDHFIVEDEGPGFPEWALPRGHEKFFSLPRPDTGQRSSGLGLSIAHEVAEIHQGSLQVQNRATGGAQVSLIVPRTRAQ